MKAFSLLFCLLALFPACGGELLKNGDFSDGKTHWFGDGVAPADLAPDNPLAAKNPEAATKELVVPLNPHHWTKVTQEFRTHAGQYTVMRVPTPSRLSTLSAPCMRKMMFLTTVSPIPVP